ncbi:PDDEXK nuclease domain-containing protein [Horticoccus sp. 23ND18S-11]|uniref:PDDEXK nuclease domain-containing protein n=1 Tax=Horticoccus sp. 23ND18S-11 TaxID=3391832 RepID=UPI0039C8C1BD
MKPASPAAPDYARFITDLKERIQSARLAAARAVNRELILLYWDIGRAIVEKQNILGWGDSIVEQLARDLQAAFPATKGFSSFNLWRMRQLHLEYSSEEFLAQAVPELNRRNARGPALAILSQPVRETGLAEKPTAAAAILAQAVPELLATIPWGHHVELLKKVKDPRARLYYLLATARFGWSRHVLLNQIKAGAYERSLKEKKSHNFPSALPEHLAEQAEEALKSSYNLEFLGIGRAIKERELEDKLVERLRDFILELGYGFCFVGRQYRLVLGQKEYFVDLLFYHRFLKALVAIDLKIGPFEPEFSGKMDFYLNLLNEKERAPDDRPSIGIILCAEKDNLEVEFALKTKANPIGVAEYQLQPKLPAEFRGKLPTARQLTDAVRTVLPGKIETEK